jgi:hypothetical protein
MSTTIDEEIEVAKCEEMMLPNLGATIWYDSKSKLFCGPLIWEYINSNEAKYIFKIGIANLISNPFWWCFPLST